MLQDATYDIPFLSMSQADFARNVHLSALLSSDKIPSMYWYGKIHVNGIELPCSKWKKRTKSVKRTLRIAKFLTTNVKIQFLPGIIMEVQTGFHFL